MSRVRTINSFHVESLHKKFFIFNIFYLYILGNSSYQTIPSNQQIPFYSWQSLVPLLATTSPPLSQPPPASSLSPPRSAPPIPLTKHEQEPLEIVDTAEFPAAEEDDDVFEPEAPVSTTEETTPNNTDNSTLGSSSVPAGKRRTQSLGAIQGKEPNSPLKVNFFLNMPIFFLQIFENIIYF